MSTLKSTNHRLILAFVVAAIAASRTHADVPSAANIERLVSTQRRAIHSGHFHIVDNDSETDAKDRKTYYSDRYEFWFDGNLRREDRKNSQGHEITCYGPEYMFHVWGRIHDYETADRALWPGADLVPLDLIDPHNPRHSMNHPLTMMLYPGNYGFTRIHDIDDLISDPMCHKHVVRQSRWNGEEALSVAFERSDNHIQMEYQVVPGKGYNVVQFKLWGPPGDDVKYKANLTMSCTLQNVAEGIWFPKHVDYINWFNDHDLEEKDTLDDEMDSVNQPIDPAVFTFAGAHIHKNTVVSQIGRAPTALFWDGEQLRNITPQDLSEIQLSKTKVPMPVKQRSLLATSSLLVGAGMIVFLFNMVIFFRRRRMAPPPTRT